MLCWWPEGPCRTEGNLIPRRAAARARGGGFKKLQYLPMKPRIDPGGLSFQKTGLWLIQLLYGV